MKGKVLLHICCAVCALESVDRLRKEGFEVTGFFYNPNIWPDSEFEKRKKEVVRISKILNFPLVVKDYERKEWKERIKGLESEPEGGKRCYECFKLRLEKTYLELEEKVFDFFTTTLSISPYKNSKLINEIGEKISEKFLEKDFKKKRGFEETIKKAKELNLYRQRYCGCEFSFRK